MKLNEAYQQLGLETSATPEEAKKKYRELSKKYHPDINKEAGADAKFKKINEAYECIKNGKGNEREERSQAWNPWGGFNRQPATYSAPPENIEIYTDISFKESILGCKKEIKYNRQSKCHDCDGQGEKKLNNGCSKCGGKGQITQKQGNMIMVSTCTQCYGKTSTENCSTCRGEGTLSSEVSVNISIPAGIANESILRLQNMGNYSGSFMGMSDQYTDVFCHVKVEADDELTLENNVVVSHLNLSLVDAIKGCNRTVKTIMGSKEIEIPILSKHKDEIFIKHVGINATGDQKVVLHINYPDDIEKLVNYLEEK